MKLLFNFVSFFLFYHFFFFLFALAAECGGKKCLISGACPRHQDFSPPHYNEQVPARSQLQTAYCQVLTIQCKTFSLCNFHFNLFVYLCTSVYNFLRQRSLIKKCSYKSPTNLHSGHPFLRAICNKTNLASSSKLDKKNLPKLT